MTAPAVADTPATHGGFARRFWSLLPGFLAFAIIACAPERADRLDVEPPGAAAAPTDAELVHAAEGVLRFLRGETGFDEIRVADSVVLYVSPDGGGTRTAVPRDQLRDRANWRAAGSGRATYHFVPPADATKLTVRAGRHINCFEYELASRFAEIAHLPHVGTKHEPPGADSCIQAWNLTLIFDEHERPPTLVAALYDQWEW